jgi:hypothetical protein
MRLIRGIILIGLTALGLMNLAGASLAQSAEIGGWPQKELAQENVPPDASIIMGIDNAPDSIAFQYWRGFALKGNESYVLRLSIEGVRPVGPMNVRRLLASNMTLEDVRKEILAREGDVTYQGHLKLGDIIYQLDDIELTLMENNLTLKAEISEPHHGATLGDAQKVVGNITVNTTSHEGAMKGQGELTIAAGLHIGSYQVFLDMSS